MTIGFLLNTCEPFYRGGYERRAWSFARELARQGHDVRIYTSCPRDETIDGVRFVRLAAPRPFFNARGVRNGRADFLFAFAVLKLITRVKTGELDVLDVCATPFVHLPALEFVAWLRHIPVVLTCHEALLAALPDYARERGLPAGLRAQLVKEVLGAIYRTGMGLFPQRLAVSNRTAAALQEEGYNAGTTVEFGLENEAMAPEPPKPRNPAEPGRIASCGRLTPIKSVDQVIAAALELAGKENIALRLDIIGDGSERDRLKAMAGGADFITFHGEVTEETKRSLLAQADIFVLASPREGFSIATLEAMAQGCAALVVSDPDRPNGVLDFVRSGQEGLVVETGAHALADGLRRLLGNRRERESLRRGAWETAQRYRIGEQAKKLVAFYKLARA